MNATKLISTLQLLIKHRKSVHQFLRFSENSKNAFTGTVQPNELEYLYELVAKANVLPGPIVEIGTLFGFTTQSLAIRKSMDKELITVDNFHWNPIGFTPEAHRDFTSRILTYLCQSGSTRIYEGSNVDFYKGYNGEKPSMVFIDAGHTYDDVMVDIEWAKSVGIPIISGHDYTPSIPGVIKAVDEVFGEKIKVVGTVWSHESSS